MPENETSTWDQLCETADEFRQRHNIPGVVVGVLHNGEIKAAGFGVTNLEHPLEVTDQTLFQIGSITKTFTGTAIMKLVEEGQADLEATVRTYLPKFQVANSRGLGEGYPPAPDNSYQRVGRRFLPRYRARRGRDRQICGRNGRIRAVGSHRAGLVLQQCGV